MSTPESSGADPARPRPRLALAALAVLVGLAVVLVVVLVTRGGGPGEAEARDLVEDYFDARIDDGCGHLRFHSKERAEEDPSPEECRELEDLEAGEYLEYEVTEVRVDGDQAEVEVEDHSDAPSGPYTVHLVVEDDEWRVDEVERRDDP